MSRSKAIRLYCIDCMGNGGNTNTPDLIRDCPSTTCALYRVRPYQKNTGRLHRAAAIQARCFDCAGRDDDSTPSPRVRVRDCACAACPLHPVRPWQGIKGRGQYAVGAETVNDRGDEVSG